MVKTMMAGLTPDRCWPRSLMSRLAQPWCCKTAFQLGYKGKRMTKLLENLNAAIVTGLVLTVLVAFIGPALAHLGGQ